jgi:hypothetical protein
VLYNFLFFVDVAGWLAAAAFAVAFAIVAIPGCFEY